MKLFGSLQARLLALVLSTVALSWLASAALTALDARHEIDELLDGHLAQAAALLVAQQIPEPGEGDGEHGHLVDAPQLHRYAPKVAFQVFHEGRLVLRSAQAPAAPLRPLGEAGKGGFATVRLDGEPWRVFAARGAERDVQVFVGERLHARSEILLAVLRSMAAPLALALPLLALLLWWAVRGGLAPLRALSRALSARAPGAAGPIALDGAPAELRPLVDELNGLLARVATLLAAERRFTADAAHELRTPIAGIRTQAQVALEAGAEAERAHALRALLAGCDRAAHLVSQLLQLARLESDGGGALAAAPIDLAALLRQEAAAVAPLALDKGQLLEIDAGPCRAQGDAVLAGALLRNLLDNAVRYSPRGARVAAVLRAEGDGAVLQVDDGGPGLPEDERRRLGERFFRALGSGEAGSGLGWSIVRRIAAVHGWQVEAQASPTLGGLRVTVRWPPPRPAGAPGGHPENPHRQH